VFEFINGQRKTVSTSQMYVEIYEVVLNQCDSEKNSGYLNDYYKAKLVHYVENDIVPYLI
jgi:hypothetical protein